MKLLFLILFLSSLNAFAQSETPIFYMSARSSGFSPEQYRTFKQCTVFNNRVEVVVKNNVGETHKTKSIVADPRWRSLIQAASNGTLVAIEIPADMGTSHYIAYLNSEEITLKAYNDDAQAVENDSAATSQLIEMINLECDF